MSDRFHLPRAWPERLTEFKIPLPALLRRAGLPEIFFQQEKIYATTAQVFALWRAVGETSSDPGIGLKPGIEPRLECYHPTAIAAVCSRSIRDALQRIALFELLVSANEWPQRLPWRVAHGAGQSCPPPPNALHRPH